MNQYTFEVSKDATKVEIAQAIEAAFAGRKVTKVRTARNKAYKYSLRKLIKNALSSK